MKIPPKFPGKLQAAHHHYRHRRPDLHFHSTCWSPDQHNFRGCARFALLIGGQDITRRKIVQTPRSILSNDLVECLRHAVSDTARRKMEINRFYVIRYCVIPRRIEPRIAHLCVNRSACVERPLDEVNRISELRSSLKAWKPESIPTLCLSLSFKNEGWSERLGTAMVCAMSNREASRGIDPINLK
jgi:hypothetical protein